ncbi:putative glyoxalase superfamily protein PhnB [Spinactinospora alkalitolerans]|uniref:Putative glyoxalase superfamily protein PhnB n=1 Tax=Spinactinospora alkalitolerans TaxID=687207 RepID=A0A852U2G9_9ACTN|nr:VOC family protein [Spinactinospora alkalitolerans]NYE48344.1 putative glyoxalase superfamily protein PhnB [Spinactinospora alkalitolerans]
MENSANPGVFPVLYYRDARAAIGFLTEAFGFTVDFCHPEEGERVDHAELSLGGGAIMLGSAKAAAEWPMAIDPAPQMLFAVVDDPDAHHDRARAAGAEIVMPPTDQEYGSREYAARDPEGNVWGFGTYWRDAAGG